MCELCIEIQLSAKMPSHSLPPHTRAQSHTQDMNKGWAVRPGFLEHVHGWVLLLPPAPPPLLKESQHWALWTCAPPYGMKCSASSRRALKSSHSHTVSHLLVICLVQDMITLFLEYLLWIYIFPYRNSASYLSFPILPIVSQSLMGCHLCKKAGMVRKVSAVGVSEAC